MKHARDPALDTIEDLLEEIRRFDGLVERKRGVFYRRGAAFLHFHEDPAGIFADLKLGGTSWRRLPVNGDEDRMMLLEQIAGLTAVDAAGSKRRDKHFRPAG